MRVNTIKHGGVVVMIHRKRLPSVTPTPNYHTFPTYRYQSGVAHPRKHEHSLAVTVAMHNTTHCLDSVRVLQDRHCM
jgi:hypothetical protein